MNHQWIVYILGAVLSTMASIIGYVNSQPTGFSTWKHIFRFYFEDKEAAVTTVLTFGFVWLLGSIYVQKMPLPYTGTIAGLPDRAVIAFCLGGLGEFIAPLTIKAIVTSVISVIQKWFS